MEKNADYTKGVGIYIRGERLNPNLVTMALGVKPTFSRKKGERWVKSAEKRSAIVKIGVWSLRNHSNTGPISDDIT
jgi:hypothetical protein